jgi:hypothetical protein
MTTQAKNAAHMKEPLGKCFDALRQELGWLNVTWAQYVELYGTKEPRADSDEVARAFRDDGARGFRHDVAQGVTPRWQW